MPVDTEQLKDNLEQESEEIESMLMRAMRQDKDIQELKQALRDFADDLEDEPISPEEPAA